MSNRLRSGALVVFRQQRRSPSPERRAYDIRPAPHGEDYAFLVDEYSTVVAVLPDGRVLVKTPRGEQDLVDPTSPRLRPAKWWERLFFRDRFPQAV
jgi:hypothetical protein